MEHAPATTQTWTWLLDPSAAHAVIEHASKVKLPRRICRPLDHRRELTNNSELAKFDAAVEAEAANDENMAEV